MNRSESPRRTPPYSAAGFPFHTLSTAAVDLPHSIDIADQTLADSLSFLSISNDDHDRRVYPPLPRTPTYSYGVAASPFSGNGNPAGEIFRAQNGLSYNQWFYSGVGQSVTRTVDPFLQHRPSSSGFDPMFDFDHISSLLAKEPSSSTQYQNSYNNRRSSNLRASVSNSDNVNFGQNQSHLSVANLHDFRGMIYQLAKNQNGSKILQSKMKNPTHGEIKLVLSEVVGSIAELMKDQFGNYLIQSLVTVCGDDQKGLIVRELTESPIELIAVCMNPYGTRAVQKLLENLKNKNAIVRVIRALHHFAVQLAIDLNGHHVVHDCLLHFGSDFTQPIIDRIADNCFKVATDRSGCCVLQTCIEHSHGQVRNRLVTKLMSCTIQIAEDPYGNYVLQHMVGLQSPHLTELLVLHLQGYFVSLSQNKYASNVVEKCLQHSRLEVLTTIVFELVKSPHAPSLLVDPYGNFVIQSALKVSKGYAYECLLKLILRNVDSMKNNIYGKKILEKIEKKRFVHN